MHTGLPWWATLGKCAIWNLTNGKRWILTFFALRLGVPKYIFDKLPYFQHGNKSETKRLSKKALHDYINSFHLKGQYHEDFARVWPHWKANSHINIYESLKILVIFLFRHHTNSVKLSLSVFGHGWPRWKWITIWKRLADVFKCCACILQKIIENLLWFALLALHGLAISFVFVKNQHNMQNNITKTCINWGQTLCLLTRSCDARIEIQRNRDSLPHAVLKYGTSAPPMYTFSASRCIKTEKIFQFETQKGYNFGNFVRKGSQPLRWRNRSRNSLHCITTKYSFSVQAVTLFLIERHAIFVSSVEFHATRKLYIYKDVRRSFLEVTHPPYQEVSQ